MRPSRRWLINSTKKISHGHAKFSGNFAAWEKRLRKPMFNPRAVVIRLQAAGFRTVIFEKRDLPGGRAYVYRDNGFTFDAGPTVITAPDCLRELFTLAGKSMTGYVELLSVYPFYRLFWEDGFSFDYSADSASVERQIASKSPADLQGYQRFLKFSEE